MGEPVVYSLGILLLSVCFLPLLYYLFSLCCVVDYFRGVHARRPPCGPFAPPVSILKPVRGIDQLAYENFASFCRLDYPEYEIVFAASDPYDPVVHIVQKLQEDFPHRRIRVLTGFAGLGTNNKVNNLCRLVHEAQHDLVVMSDSDVRVDADYLREVVAPFADPQVGLVTALFRGLPVGGTVSYLNALGMYADSAPSALVARKLEHKMQFAFGWTMATTKSVLAQIGGLESIVNYHSDDFELGNRVSRLGYRVEFMRTAVWMVCPKETLRDFFKHELRWAIGLRNVRPVGYLGVLLTHGLPWSILAAIAAASAGWLGTVVAFPLAYLCLRLSLVWTAGVWGLGDRRIARKLYLVPLRDLLSFAAWIGGLFSSRIVWRGLSYHVYKGFLVPAEAGKGARAVRTAQTAH